MSKVFDNGTVWDDMVGCSGLLLAEDLEAELAWAAPIPWAGPCATEVLGGYIGEVEDLRPWGCTYREPLDVRYLGLAEWMLRALASLGDEAAQLVVDDLDWEAMAREEAEIARSGIEVVY